MFYRTAQTFGRGLFRALQRNQKRIAMTALPIFLFSQQVSQRFMAQEAEAPQETVEVSQNGKSSVTPKVDATGAIQLCHKNDLKDGELKLYTVGDKKILLAKIGGQYYACDAVSPVDNKTLLDSTLLIGDKIYDIVNGAIFSIKDGVTEYSPNLEQLKVLKVNETDDHVISVRYTNEKPFFDTVNMRGWVPDFTNLVILGSGIESINIIRTLRQAKYRGLITLMFGEDIDGPYDLNLLFEDLENTERPPIREKEFYEQFQVKIAKNKEKVKYINIDEQVIKTVQGKEDPVPYQKLVYSLGIRPRFHGVSGLGLQGIYQPCSLTEFKQIKKDSANFKNIVIVGDTVNSIRLACNLKKNTKANITLVTESSNVLSKDNLGEDISATLVQELKNTGVKVVKSQQLKAIEGTKAVEQVELSKDKIKCDALFLMREEFPNIDPLESSMRLCSDGALYTDSFQRTVSQNMWTVGPTASIIAPFIASRLAYRNSGDVLLQAHTTALNLIEKRLALRTIPFDKVKVGNTQINKIGFPEVSNRAEIVGDQQSNNYMVYYFRDDQLVGAATPSRYRDLTIVREALFQDIIPRGKFEINIKDLENKIFSLSAKKLNSKFMENMRKRPHMTK
ncbi:pyridine nucleotide-disulfide oxidoreductase (macronuclear) [Tetrahymena thermophila SB210]|uniref:Pyridine nucleotide-disulfide oxidoreductase n=1 Tax=Tetrahymena thermophila (strain SB210) TaxID=312017 RepID=I7MM64_TETTS|nr:pyridine nucleotide-disulfide oxidoreductase [Tetrahymena thermophila SB210]EAS04247.1 pyridine nucleotide-disulfide oxidoreductase [Tetrahymena thermophila SB210]|eukprot:XP_001024492.1 pyridine nucleotide-disulfide oxidoreductase [Tetrahymena thermophila SB210]